MGMVLPPLGPSSWMMGLPHAAFHAPSTVRLGLPPYAAHDVWQHGLQHHHAPNRMTACEAHSQSITNQHCQAVETCPAYCCCCLLHGTAAGLALLIAGVHTMMHVCLSAAFLVAGLPPGSSVGAHPPMVPGWPGLPGSCPAEPPQLGHAGQSRAAVLPLPGLPVSAMSMPDDGRRHGPGAEATAAAATRGCCSTTAALRKTQPVKAQQQHVKPQQAGKQQQVVRQPAAVRWFLLLPDLLLRRPKMRAAPRPVHGLAAPRLPTRHPALLAPALLAHRDTRHTHCGSCCCSCCRWWWWCGGHPCRAGTAARTALKPWVASHFEDVYMLLGCMAPRQSPRCVLF